MTYNANNPHKIYEGQQVVIQGKRDTYHRAIVTRMTKTQAIVKREAEGYSSEYRFSMASLNEWGGGKSWRVRSIARDYSTERGAYGLMDWDGLEEWKVKKALRDKQVEQMQVMRVTIARMTSLIDALTEHKDEQWSGETHLLIMSLENQRAEYQELYKELERF